jgi:hypothetical protein
MPEYGFHTSTKTKPLIINGLAAFIRDRAGNIKSKAALQECLTYAYEPNGSTNARSGCYDDRVVAFALALYGLSERPYSAKRFVAITARELYGASTATGY